VIIGKINHAAIPTAEATRVHQLFVILGKKGLGVLADFFVPPDASLLFTLVFSFCLFIIFYSFEVDANWLKSQSFTEPANGQFYYPSAITLQPNGWLASRLAGCAGLGSVYNIRRRRLQAEACPRPAGVYPRVAGVYPREVPLFP
jgi:hypothetical protein